MGKCDRENAYSNFQRWPLDFLDLARLLPQKLEHALDRTLKKDVLDRSIEYTLPQQRLESEISPSLLAK